jgi:hypothetical protein
MNKEETKAIVQILKNVYRDKFDIKQGAFEIWCECMSDLRFDVAKKAAMEYIKKSQYAPTVADIRNEYKILWDEYTAMIRHINESFDSAVGCYPEVTAEQRANGYSAFLKFVGGKKREQRERVAREISQRIIDFVQSVEEGKDTNIVPFDKCMEKEINEFRS